ncbi:MAG: hypothetical protein ACLU99_14920 [Alphaproteobacteria bacterium]
MTQYRYARDNLDDLLRFTGGRNHDDTENPQTGGRFHSFPDGNGIFSDTPRKRTLHCPGTGRTLTTRPEEV